MAEFEAREIGERIQRARKERGLTQEELAEMGSFSKRSLGDYETGVTIPYRHLREIGRLLDKPPEWFLYGEEAVSGNGAPSEQSRLLKALDAKIDVDVTPRLDRIEGELRALHRALSPERSDRSPGE